MEHYYTKLLQEWEANMDTLEARVFSILRQAYPNGRTREQLVMDVYGEFSQTNINNDTRDRGIRKAISNMRRRDIPIFSTSGEAGYRLELSENELGKMIAEMRRKRENLDDQIRSLETTAARLRHARDTALPEQYPPKPKAEQLSLI